MQTLIHADIFFFISSIGFILIAATVFVGLLYLISILQSVRRITEKIETSMDTVGEDAKEFVSDLRESTVFRMIFGGRRRKNVSTKKQTTDKESK